MTARGRPRVLTPAMVAEIARRREIEESHDEIGRALGIPAGTSRYGAWLARHPDALCQTRLQFVSEAETSTETSAKANGGGGA